MADTKISAFTAAATLGGTELVPIVQGGANLSTTIAKIISLAGAILVLPSGDATGATDSAAVQAAVNTQNSAGAGIVQLVGGRYYFGTPIVPMSGVRIEGISANINYTTNNAFIPDSNLVLTNGGTYIDCKGGAGFQWAKTVQGVPTQQAFTAAGTTNFTIKNMGFTNYSRAIDAGNTNNPAAWYAEFENLYMAAGTDWGFWITNFQHCKFRRIYAYGNTTGQQWYGNDVPSSVLQPGNSMWEDIFGAPPNLLTSRGLVWNAAQGQQNEGYLTRIQNNRVTNSSTQAATMAAPIATTITNTSASIAATNTFAANDRVSFSATTGTSGGQVVAGTIYYVSATGLSGSAFQVSTTVGGAVITFNASGTPNVQIAKFAVTDGTKFAVGMPVQFSATANGFTQWRTYFVLSVSTNVLTVSLTFGGNAVTSTGNTAVNIVTQGFPGIEVIALPGAQINAHIFNNLDAESAGTTAIAIQNVAGSIFSINQLPGTAQSTMGVTGRGLVDCQILSPNGTNTDFDNNANSSAVQYSGARQGTSVGYMGAGIWYDAVSGNTVLSNGSNFDTQSVGMLQLVGGSKVMPGSLGITQKASFSASANPTLGDANLSVVSTNGVAGTTITLPTISSSNVGVWGTFFNGTASAQTLNTNGTQLFNNVTGRTSLTINPNASVRICAGYVGSSTYTWIIEGASSAIVSGVVSAPT